MPTGLWQSNICIEKENVILKVVTSTHCKAEATQHVKNANEGDDSELISSKMEERFELFAAEDFKENSSSTRKADDQYQVSSDSNGKQKSWNPEAILGPGTLSSARDCHRLVEAMQHCCQLLTYFQPESLAQSDILRIQSIICDLSNLVSRKAAFSSSQMQYPSESDNVSKTKELNSFSSDPFVFLKHDAEYVLNASKSCLPSASQQLDSTESNLQALLRRLDKHLNSEMNERYESILEYRELCQGITADLQRLKQGQQHKEQTFLKVKPTQMAATFSSDIANCRINSMFFQDAGKDQDWAPEDEPVQKLTGVYLNGINGGIKSCPTVDEGRSDIFDRRVQSLNDVIKNMEGCRNVAPRSNRVSDSLQETAILDRLRVLQGRGADSTEISNIWTEPDTQCCIPQKIDNGSSLPNVKESLNMGHGPTKGCPKTKMQENDISWRLAIIQECHRNQYLNKKLGNSEQLQGQLTIQSDENSVTASSLVDSSQEDTVYDPLEYVCQEKLSTGACPYARTQCQGFPSNRVSYLDVDDVQKRLSILKKRNEDKAQRHLSAPKKMEASVIKGTDNSEEQPPEKKLGFYSSTDLLRTFFGTMSDELPSDERKKEEVSGEEGRRHPFLDNIEAFKEVKRNFFFSDPREAERDEVQMRLPNLKERGAFDEDEVQRRLYLLKNREESSEINSETFFGSENPKDTKQVTKHVYFNFDGVESVASNSGSESDWQYVADDEAMPAD